MIYAILSGFFAASGSVFGKFAVSDQNSELLGAVCTSLPSFCESGIPKSYVLFGLRASHVLLMVLVNVVMWAAFTKALKVSESAIQASSINTASNIFSTGLLGWLVFGETVSVRWILGVSVILCGVLLINSTTPQEGTEALKKEKAQ